MANDPKSYFEHNEGSGHYELVKFEDTSIEVEEAEMTDEMQILFNGEYIR